MSEASRPRDENAFTARYPTRIHRLECAGTTIDLLAPSNPDVLLDDPVTHARYAADSYMPYWPIIWPSGLMLAERILQDTATPPAWPAAGGSAIELGCGLGLAGIAAARRGWSVLWTDYDHEAILFAAHNARRNHIPPERIRARHMDWRDPVAERFNWIIASDVLYERRLHPLLLGAIAALLAPEGTAWVSDPQRSSAEDFPIHAVAAGFRVAASPLSGVNPTGGALPGTLYVLTRAG